MRIEVAGSSALDKPWRGWSPVFWSSFDALYIREAALSIASLFQAAQYQAFKQKGGFGLDFQTGYLVGAFDNVCAAYPGYH